MAATAASVDTLVLVLRLLNIIATVWPERAPATLAAPDDPSTSLCVDARRTKAVSSAGFKSEMDSRCRGANGEVNGAAKLEYLSVRMPYRSRPCALPFVLRMLCAHRRVPTATAAIVSSTLLLRLNGKCSFRIL